jgi:LuxR family transcriptional regulator, maltose regulon positive regulatory protein
MPKPTIAQVAWNAQTSIYQVHETQEGTSLSPLDLESQAWQEWLAQRSSFAFQGKDGYRFTARKEARARGNTYWVAYRKVGGKLTHTYIGRPEDVTLARLEGVAGFLACQPRSCRPGMSRPSRWDGRISTSPLNSSCRWLPTP